MTTKELDRRFRKVGRIKRSWGSNHAPTIRRMEQMLDVLFSSGRLDILRSLKAKEYTPLEVYSYYRVNNLEGLPTAATLAPLKETFTKWIAKKECSESHRRSLSQSMRHLLKGSRSTLSVGDLPDCLTAMRAAMQGKHPRSFNLARAAAQAFAKSTQGKDSTLWKEITRVEVLKVTPQRTKHPMTPKELRAITKKMKPAYADIAWGMASTGMGPDEFWGNWEMNLNSISIHGTKRKGRDRIVPLLMPITRPATLYPAFRRALEAASDMRPYDLRRTYANWLEAANVPNSRAIQYMGHKPPTMTDLYRWHEVSRYLDEDAQRLKAYVFGGASQEGGLKLEKA